MKKHKIGIIMNGVTGRMGTNQHLIRSLSAIINEGGIKVNEQDIILPELVLVGRNENKLKKLSERVNVKKWTTNLEGVLADDQYQIYFDAQTTGRRAEAIKKAVDCYSSSITHATRGKLISRQCSSVQPRKRGRTWQEGQ